MGKGKRLVSLKKTPVKQVEHQSSIRTRGRGPLAPPADSSSEEHLSADENEAESTSASGLGSALNTFRAFRDNGNATALVDSLTSNELLSAPEDEPEHNEDYAAAVAETTRGIRRNPTRKVSGKRVPAARQTKGKGKGRAHEKKKDTTFRIESIIILPEGIVPLGGDKEEAETKDELAVNLGGRFFALPPQFKKTTSTLSVSTLTSYQQEGLAVTDSNGGLLFDTQWSKEECSAYIFEKLPHVTQLLHKREEDDPKGRPAILTCTRQGPSIRLAGITMPDGNDVYRCTQKPGRNYRGTVLILTSHQKISFEEREHFRKEIALQEGNEGLCASDWDDLQVDSQGNETDDNPQPVRIRKRSRVESDEEEESDKSETEVQTQLASSSPSPMPPPKKRKLQSHCVTSEPGGTVDEEDSARIGAQADLSASNRVASPEAGPSKRWSPDWSVYTLQYSTWGKANLSF
ncbi:hypothetical protein BT96DRAFT_999210 [Gymnopus androsaceus JB14]|uniref:Uncharacterized protein n=1 Tax=Gymnopus androsaceus JB14 TaxID=1447944 RepID=A0A6A4H935_9AGAR|nr:hypothetical protein BT96DRAFT_999210 [Gymnopus androsaceus JB14]